MQKYTHPVHTAKELATKQTSADMAKTQVKDPKGTKLRIMVIQQMKVINQERPNKMLRHPFS